jgi:hypothetical protein
MNNSTILPSIVIQRITELHQSRIWRQQHITMHLEEGSSNTQETCFQADPNTHGFYEKLAIQGKISSEDNRKECEAFNCFAEATTTI